MSTIAPNSEIYLIKAPLESDNLNQLNFSSRQSQLAYFQSLPHLVFDKYTYIRQDGSIQIEGNADEIMRYNYILYKNTSYGNKWIFAFITNIEFLANSVSRISFRTDVFNTWYFDVTFKTSYVEREHTNNDAIGANTLNEEIGESEYICNAGTEIPIVDNLNYFIAIQCSDAPKEIKDYLAKTPRVYGGIRSGAWIFLIEATGAGSNANFDNLIKWFDYDAKTEAIIAMYVLPKAFAPNATIMSLEDSTGKYGADIYALPTTLNAYTTDTREIEINTTIDGYTPRNNRLFCYPYNYIKLSNHAGSDTVLKWEEFKTTGHKAVFVTHAIPNQGIDSRIIPKYYKMASENIHAFYDYGLTGGKMPLLSWQSDYYLNWQATNGINIINHSVDYVTDRYNTTLAGDAGDARDQYVQRMGSNNGGYYAGEYLLSLATGAGQTGMALASGAGQWVKSIMGDISGAGFKAFMTPNTISGCSNIGDLNFAERMATFSVQKMSIKAEMARIVDNYFDMFGYKTLRHKLPNINGRRNWNYVKTKNCNIEGDIPQKDIEELKAIFNGGVTIWHNPNTYLDYTQNNDII